MGKFISGDKPAPTIEISEQSDGFWLWDTTREMNLAMKAKTREAAFVEALQYYQRRAKEVEQELKELRAKVDSFLDQFKDDDD